MQTAAHRMQRGRSDLTVSAAKKVWCPECVPGTIFFTKGQGKIKRFFREFPLYLSIKCGMIKDRR
jgi:hypothetical protein